MVVHKDRRAAMLPGGQEISKADSEFVLGGGMDLQTGGNHVFFAGRDTPDRKGHEVQHPVGKF